MSVKKKKQQKSEVGIYQIENKEQNKNRAWSDHMDEDDHSNDDDDDSRPSNAHRR